MALQKSKTDFILGIQIQKHLEKLGLHTPIIKEKLEVSDDIKIQKIELLTKEILETLGLDLKDDSLIETPNRIAKMFVQEDFWGLKPENFPKNTVIENKMKVDEMVKISNIKVVSRCEHHIEKILGYAYIAYLPKDNVIGLSKISRVVDYFCKRPQVQERITEQIFHALQFMLGTDNIAVYINAEHLCMTTRGIEDPDAKTSTSKLGGIFKSDPAARAEFFQLLKA